MYKLNDDHFVAVMLVSGPWILVGLFLSPGFADLLLERLGVMEGDAGVQFILGSLLTVLLWTVITVGGIITTDLLLGIFWGFRLILVARSPGRCCAHYFIPAHCYTDMREIPDQYEIEPALDEQWTNVICIEFKVDDLRAVWNYMYQSRRIYYDFPKHFKVGVNGYFQPMISKHALRRVLGMLPAEDGRVVLIFYQDLRGVAPHDACVQNWFFKYVKR